MSNTLSINATKTFAEDLYEFLCEIDASRWRAEMISALERRLEHLQAHLSQLAEAAATASHRELRRGFAELERVLSEHQPDPSLPARRQWKRLRQRLLPAYEALAVGLRAEAVTVPVIRPTNYSRIGAHITGMVFVLALLVFELSTPALLVTALTAAGTCWILETLRQFSGRINLALMAFFHRIAHPVERHKVNSATWYATSLIALALLDAPLIGGVAVTVLGLGDPVAGLVGRRWGRVRLFQRRTLEGSLGFVFAATAAAFTFIVLVHPEVQQTSALIIAAAAAITGAVTELLSNRLDDNLTIPLSSAAAALVATWLVAPSALTGALSPLSG